ncbi:MAG: hypothetical protein ACYDDG_14030 [Casimicrobiaceae bacterium]
MRDIAHGGLRERVMSIYGGRRGWKDFNDVFQKRAASGAPGETAASAAAAGDGWLDARKAAPANYLLSSTRKWIESLPDDVHPNALATRYPRIVNLIAAQWTDHGTCPLLFEDLLGDRRGGRAGFPPDVHRDLVCLQEFWFNGHGLR